VYSPWDSSSFGIHCCKKSSKLLVNKNGIGSIFSTPLTCKQIKLLAKTIYRKKEFRNTLYAFQNDFYSLSVVDRIIHFRHKRWYQKFGLLKVRCSLDFYLVKRRFGLILRLLKKICVLLCEYKCILSWRRK